MFFAMLALRGGVMLAGGALALESRAGERHAGQKCGEAWGRAQEASGFVSGRLWGVSKCVDRHIPWCTTSIILWCIAI